MEALHPLCLGCEVALDDPGTEFASFDRSGKHTPLAARRRRRRVDDHRSRP
jgi:hypothetical protein